MRQLIIIIISGLFFSNIFANENMARQLYMKKDYKKASDLYIELEKQFPNNIVYQYNIASTYYRLGQKINAKYHYLKGLKLSPNNKDIKYNIRLINKSFIDQKFMSKRYWGHVFGLNYNVLLTGSLLFLFVFLLFISFKRGKFSHKFKRIILVVFFILIVTNLTIGGMVYTQPSYGIIKEKKTGVYSGPSETQNILFFTHKGSDYVILKVSKDWLKVQFPNGMKGWVKQGACLII